MDQESVTTELESMNQSKNQGMEWNQSKKQMSAKIQIWQRGRGISIMGLLHKENIDTSIIYKLLEETNFTNMGKSTIS